MVRREPFRYHASGYSSPVTARADDEEKDPLRRKLEHLPTASGCYVFLDRAGATLYVGKAKNLRSRVRSYFQAAGSDTRAFLPLLRRHVADLETLVTASE
jgi:excinuclease ABC subunit C